MARLSRSRRPCYATKRRGASRQVGDVISPWGRPAPPPPPGLERFSTPLRPESPPLAGLKQRLSLGRVRFPHIPSTVSARPRSDRVEQAFKAVQVFDAVETDATAYEASIAVGSAHLVVTTNFKSAVFRKTGGGPLLETSLRAWFASVLPTEVDVVFDPRILYDQHDSRWVCSPRREFTTRTFRVRSYCSQCRARRTLAVTGWSGRFPRSGGARFRGRIIRGWASTRRRSTFRRISSAPPMRPD